MYKYVSLTGEDFEYLKESETAAARRPARGVLINIALVTADEFKAFYQDVYIGEGDKALRAGLETEVREFFGMDITRLSQKELFSVLRNLGAYLLLEHLQENLHTNDVYPGLRTKLVQGTPLSLELGYYDPEKKKDVKRMVKFDDWQTEARKFQTKVHIQWMKHGLLDLPKGLQFQVSEEGETGLKVKVKIDPKQYSLEKVQSLMKRCVSEIDWLIKSDLNEVKTTVSKEGVTFVFKDFRCIRYHFLSPFIALADEAPYLRIGVQANEPLLDDDAATGYPFGDEPDHERRILDFGQQPQEDYDRFYKETPKKERDVIRAQLRIALNSALGMPTHTLEMKEVYALAKTFVALRDVQCHFEDVESGDTQVFLASSEKGTGFMTLSYTDVLTCERVQKDIAIETAQKALLDLKAFKDAQYLALREQILRGVSSSNLPFDIQVIDISTLHRFILVVNFDQLRPGLSSSGAHEDDLQYTIFERLVMARAMDDCLLSSIGKFEYTREYNDNSNISRAKFEFLVLRLPAEVPTASASKSRGQDTEKKIDLWHDIKTRLNETMGIGAIDLASLCGPKVTVTPIAGFPGKYRLNATDATIGLHVDRVVKKDSLEAEVRQLRQDHESAVGIKRAVESYLPFNVSLSINVQNRACTITFPKGELIDGYYSLHDLAARAMKDIFDTLLKDHQIKALRPNQGNPYVITLDNVALSDFYTLLNTCDFKSLLLPKINDYRKIQGLGDISSKSWEKDMPKGKRDPF